MPDYAHHARAGCAQQEGAAWISERSRHASSIDLGRDCKERPRTGRWLVMVSVEYCVLQIGMGPLNIVRLARPVFQSKGARDSFQ